MQRMCCESVWQSCGCLVQTFKAAARGLLRALNALHSEKLVHCDVKAENVVWSDNKSWKAVVLVDLDMVCKENTAMPEERRLTSWDAAATLDRHGRYGKESDVYEAGKLLKGLAAGQPWSASVASFCNELIAKKPTIPAALAHPYLSG